MNPSGGWAFISDEVASFTPDSLVFLPALPKLSDIYFGALGLKNGSLSTRGCGLVLPVGLIMSDKNHYQTFNWEILFVSGVFLQLAWLNF